MASSKWIDAVAVVAASGLLVLSGEVTENIYSGSAPYGWAAVAKELAGCLPGLLMPIPSGGVSYKCGGGPLAGVIIDTDTVRPIMKAREVVGSVIPATDREKGIPYTFGACARKLLQWAAEAQSPDATCERLIGEGTEQREHMYHDCLPGMYPAAVMYDCSGYFFQLLHRLPSLRVSLGAAKGADPGRIRWQRMTLDERHKWADVLAACSESKVLRNSLWGASLGSKAGRLAYTSAPPKDAQKRPLPWPKGKVREVYPSFGPGPFRPAALVLARAAAEMTQLASMEVGSVYSTVDSVTTIDGRVPEVWGRMGLPFGPKHAGEAHIVSRGVWRIGGSPTIPYCPMIKCVDAAGAIMDGRKVTSWKPDLTAALAAGYVPRLPANGVERAAITNYYFAQWL